MEVIQVITICSIVDNVHFCFVIWILCKAFILLLSLSFSNIEDIRNN